MLLYIYKYKSGKVGRVGGRKEKPKGNTKRVVCVALGRERRNGRKMVQRAVSLFNFFLLK